MHELSITQNILSIALEHARAVQAKKINKIDITIGELSGIVDDCVRFYFDFLSKDTIAAQATLCFHQTPLKLRCRNCQAVFTPGDTNWLCPSCHEPKVDVISGREGYISSIEVD